MTFRSDKLPPPPKTESYKELYRWNYRLFELVNAIQSLIAGGVENTPVGLITATNLQDVVSQIDTLMAAVNAEFDDHSARHENGGADEISVVGLSGLLGDSQTPLTHGTSHENGGTDEISVVGLSGELADDQPALTHGNERHDPPSVFPVGSLYANLTGDDPAILLGYGTWYLVTTL